MAIPIVSIHDIEGTQAWLATMPSGVTWKHTLMPTSHMVVFFELNESQWLAKYLVVTCGFLDFGVSWH